MIDTLAILLIWSANTEPDLAGYRVSWGRSSGQYQYFADTADTTYPAIPGRFYVVQAYDRAGNYSLPSREVHAILPADTIGWGDTLEFRISRNRACTDTVALFWKASHESWPGKYDPIFPGQNWQAIGDTISVWMETLSRYLDIGLSWHISFRFQLGDKAIETERYLLPKQNCAFIIERIK